MRRQICAPLGVSTLHSIHIVLSTSYSFEGLYTVRVHKFGIHVCVYIYITNGSSHRSRSAARQHSALGTSKDGLFYAETRSFPFQKKMMACSSKCELPACATKSMVAVRRTPPRIWSRTPAEHEPKKLHQNKLNSSLPWKNCDANDVSACRGEISDCI